MKKNRHAVILGKKGGVASAKALTKEQRTERAKHAVAARENKRKEGRNKDQVINPNK